MNRRQFLRLSGLTPALLMLQQIPFAAAASPGSLQSVRLAPDDARVLMAVVERMTETGTSGAPAPNALGTLSTIEAILSRLDAELVSALRIALRVVEWWPAVLEGKFQRFSKLAPDAQTRSLEGWRSSGIAARRAVFAALRNLALLAYWSRPETWPLIGYGGPGGGRRP